jgi:hypothetical protein
MAVVAVIGVTLVGRAIYYYMYVPPILVGTYVAHYGNVTQKLILKPGGIYEQAISIGDRKLTNRGRWKLASGLSGGTNLFLEHSLSDNVDIGDAPGSFIYSDDNMAIDRDFSERTMIAINEDENLYFTRQ